MLCIFLACSVGYLVRVLYGICVFCRLSVCSADYLPFVCSAVNMVTISALDYNIYVDRIVHTVNFGDHTDKSFKCMERYLRVLQYGKNRESIAGLCTK